MTETIGELLQVALASGQIQVAPDVQRMVDDLFARDAEPLTAEQRQRFIAATGKALAWRRRRILMARCTVWCVAKMLRHNPDWHSLHECERHGHHPLTGPRAAWTGPYDMETAIVDTSGQEGVRSDGAD